MYQKFIELLKEKGVTPYAVSKQTGISQSTLTDWKKGRSEPKIDKLQKLAAYFDVPVTDFLAAAEEQVEYKPEQKQTRRKK